MGVLVKIFPKLKSVTMEYNGVPLTRRGRVATEDYNIRPLGVGVYRAAVSAEDDIRVEITTTCPSVMAAWEQLFKSWDTVTLEYANKAVTAILGVPDRNEHITPTTLLGWLAMEAFDGGEEGSEKVRKLVGDESCDFWEKTWARRPEGSKFSDLRRINNSQDAGGLWLVNTMKSSSSKYFLPAQQ